MEVIQRFALGKGMEFTLFFPLSQLLQRFFKVGCHYFCNTNPFPKRGHHHHAKKKEEQHVGSASIDSSSLDTDVNSEQVTS